MVAKDDKRVSELALKTKGYEGKAPSEITVY